MGGLAVQHAGRAAWVAFVVRRQALVFTPTLYYSFSNRVKLTISN